MLLIVGMLAACAGGPRPNTLPSTPSAASQQPGPNTGQPERALPAVLLRAKSRWTPVDWSELPGFDKDPLFEAWNAWLKSCERSISATVSLCPEVRRLSLGSQQEKIEWIKRRLQPYRVEPLQGEDEGLLTGYYEPVLEASRVATSQFKVPLYQPPLGLGQTKPWYSREEIDTLPSVQAQMRGRELVYLADPIDALILQIQGSGRIRLLQPDGSSRMIRLAYAGTNDQPYKSVGRWLLDQGLVKDASWPGIKAWARQNPKRVQEMLWSNPRTVFFREEALLDPDAGPRGAQGVALTPGRSIAVDPLSIPYGTPVWLASNGAQINLQKLVLAQDTGSAIVGAVRADYFTGWGAPAGELAGRLKQRLQLWVLWPK